METTQLLIEEAKHSSYPYINSSLYFLLTLSINIKAFTWSKDSYGLYDYETLNVTRNVLKVEPGAVLTTLCRSENDIITCSNKDFEHLSKNSRLAKLASIISQDGIIIVSK